MSDRSRPTQPVRAPTGGDYGARKQLEGAQQAVPLPNNRALPATATGSTGAAPPMIQPPDVFAPTGRPSEPISAGANQMLPADDAETLRAAWLAYPTPGLKRILDLAAKQARRRG